MKYVDFYSLFRARYIISLDEIRKFQEWFPRLNIVNRTKKGYIKQIVRWWYIFSDININEDVLYYIANKIYEPSYVSMETALSYYGLIPEWVFTVTSISTKKTQKFNTGVWNFDYRSCKENLMFGYKLITIGTMTYKIAEIEKAVLDFFYFRSDLKTADDFEDLRFDTYEFLQQADISKFKKYLKQYSSAKFISQMESFLSYTKQNA